MGTPLPPNEPGELCDVCFGPDKTFGDVATPRVVTITFSDFQPGETFDPADEQLLLTPHILTQRLFPCEWSTRDSSFEYLWSWRDPFRPHQIFHINTSTSAFFAIGTPNCLLAYDNELQSPTGNFAFGGTLEVTWNLEGL